MLTPDAVSIDGRPVPSPSRASTSSSSRPAAPIATGHGLRGRRSLPRHARGCWAGAARSRSSRCRGRRWPPTSRTSHPGGSRSTTTRGTRRPTTSTSPWPAARRWSATAPWSPQHAPGAGPRGTGGWTGRWRATSRSSRPGSSAWSPAHSHGLPWTVAVSRYFDRRSQDRLLRLMKKSPAIARWLSTQFGPYPFDSTGGVVTAIDTGFALENQSRPTYPFLGPGPRGALRGRARARPPVVRRPGLGPAVARHLAQRGLRDLGRVALRRDARPRLGLAPAAAGVRRAPAPATRSGG